MFPQEIIDLFVRELSSLSPKPRIGPLLSVSSAFRAAAQRILFEEIRIDYHLGEDWSGRSNARCALLFDIISSDQSCSVVGAIKTVVLGLVHHDQSAPVESTPATTTQTVPPRPGGIVPLLNILAQSSITSFTIQCRYPSPPVDFSTSLDPDAISALVSIRSNGYLQKLELENLRAIPYTLLTGLSNEQRNQSHGPVSKVGELVLDIEAAYNRDTNTHYLPHFDTLSCFAPTSAYLAPYLHMLLSAEAPRNPTSPKNDVMTPSTARSPALSQLKSLELGSYNYLAESDYYVGAETIKHAPTLERVILKDGFTCSSIGYSDFVLSQGLRHHPFIRSLVFHDIFLVDDLSPIYNLSKFLANCLSLPSLETIHVIVDFGDMQSVVIVNELTGGEESQYPGVWDRFERLVVSQIPSLRKLELEFKVSCQYDNGQDWKQEVHSAVMSSLSLDGRVEVVLQL